MRKPRRSKDVDVIFSRQKLESLPNKLTGGPNWKVGLLMKAGSLANEKTPERG